MARGAGRTLGAAFLERGDQAFHTRVHQRREADEQARGHRHAERKEQHRKIHGDFAGPWKTRGIRTEQRANANAGEYDAEDAADEGQQQAFGHELTQQSPAGRADGRPHRELAMA